MDLANKSIVALELYSGIGGFHYALQDIRGSSICAAVDINTTANETYTFNFPHHKLFQRNIQSFTSQEIDGLNVNFLWMSPPCQPFTRLGKQLDCEDTRTDSFLHLVDTIPKLKKKPAWILLENVKGFETSQACLSFKRMLEQLNYGYQEFLLSPNQIGIPNSRLRYYIVAKARPLQFLFQTTSEIMVAFSTCTPMPYSVEPKLRLRNFLEESENDFPMFHVPDKVLLKYSNIFDIVSSDSDHSCCFTKGYSHYVEGTGSILHTDENVKISDVYHAIETVGEDEKLRLLKTLKLRYFTPREVANLMGFPADFRFPEHFTARQKYRLLGNSLNVAVVRQLLNICIN